MRTAPPLKKNPQQTQHFDSTTFALFQVVKQETQGQMFCIFFLSSFLSAFQMSKTSLIQHSIFTIQSLPIDFWSAFKNPWHSKTDRRLRRSFFHFPFSLTYMNTFILSSLIRCWTMSVHFCFSLFYLWLVRNAGAFTGSQWNRAVVHCCFRDHVQISISLQLQMWRNKRINLENFSKEKW